VIFGIADTEARCGPGYRVSSDWHGRLSARDPSKAGRAPSPVKGIRSLRFTFERVRNSARMVLRDGPEAVRGPCRRVLVDERILPERGRLFGPAVDLHRLIPPMVQDDRFPPFWFGWAAEQDRLSRLRNRLAILLLLRIATPIFREVNQQRSAWGLEPFSVPKMRCRRWRKLPSCRSTGVRSGRREACGASLYRAVRRPWQRPEVEFPWGASMTPADLRIDGPLSRTVRKPSSE